MKLNLDDRERKKFKDVLRGEVFQYCAGFYLKLSSMVDDYNCVDVVYGRMGYCPDDDEVTVVNCELLIHA